MKINRLRRFAFIYSLVKSYFLPGKHPSSLRYSQHNTFLVANLLCLRGDYDNLPYLKSAYPRTSSRWSLVERSIKFQIIFFKIIEVTELFFKPSHLCRIAPSWYLTDRTRWNLICSQRNWLQLSRKFKWHF